MRIKKEENLTFSSRRERFRLALGILLLAAFGAILWPLMAGSSQMFRG